MEDLKIGDVVSLESNKVLMTVEGIIDTRVYCVWFSGSDSVGWELHRDVFDIETLKLG